MLVLLLFACIDLHAGGINQTFTDILLSELRLVPGRRDSDWVWTVFDSFSWLDEPLAQAGWARFKVDPLTCLHWA